MTTLSLYFEHWSWKNEETGALFLAHRVSMETSNKGRDPFTHTEKLPNVV